MGHRLVCRPEWVPTLLQPVRALLKAYAGISAHLGAGCRSALRQALDSGVLTRGTIMLPELVEPATEETEEALQERSGKRSPASAMS